MEYNDLMKLWGSLQKIERGVPQSHYTRKVIDFSQSRNQGRDVIVKVYGDYITKSSYSGDVGDCTLRISHRGASEIPITEFKKSKGVFSSIILTSTDTSGSFVFYVGGAWSGEIETAAGDTVGILNIAGASVDPSEKDEYDTVLAAIETAVEFSGTVYSAPITAATLTDDAEHACGTIKLRDVIIKNEHASQSVMIGKTQATKALSRSENYILLPGAAIGFTQVDLAKLFACTQTDAEDPHLRIIGVGI